MLELETHKAGEPEGVLGKFALHSVNRDEIAQKEAAPVDEPEVVQPAAKSNTRMQMFDQRVVNLKEFDLTEILECTTEGLSKWSKKNDKLLRAKSHPDKSRKSKEYLKKFNCSTADQYYVVVCNALEVVGNRDLLNQYFSLHYRPEYPTEANLLSEPLKHNSKVAAVLNEMRIFSHNYPKDFEKMYCNEEETEVKQIQMMYKNYENMRLTKRYYSDDMYICDSKAGREDRRHYQRENARIEEKLRLKDSEEFSWFLRVARKTDPRLQEAAKAKAPVISDPTLQQLLDHLNDIELQEAVRERYNKASPKQRKAWTTQKPELVIAQFMATGLVKH